ncbi:hypothetical protein BS47DRAFT_1371086 [Hydnum rufescens UP504]|uniref:Uncharacterized protein n=1 Tax=Hydnum rufescens UP504 TaxID=1448309 RepID=A0A9P6DY85_9AGAM|nr:hypothetical protein BS47DRAFT_1371086 [Hydnum rufescens UP504]
MSKPAESPKATKYERILGDNELSYFLPSRADGANDMYLHIGFRARRDVVNSPRIFLIWSILRLRHPLLASHVEMEEGMYDSVRFAYVPPLSARDALLDGEANVEICPGRTKDELIDGYLNGPRTLSNTRLSYLIVSHSTTDDLGNLDPDAITEFNIMICAAHFLGDGMALHQTANDFFSLLGGKSEESCTDCVRSVDELYAILEDEWKLRWACEASVEQPIPATTESRLPSPKCKFQRAALKVDFENSQDRLVGGHTFPRIGAGTRRTIVPTVSFDKARTKAILKKCKSEGVTISNALFALCNFAWMRTMRARDDLAIPDSLRDGSVPMMMYSALNMRPYLDPPLPLSHLPSSYWFLSVGYFNIVLPSFIPSTAPASSTFWHRARSVKAQGGKYMKSPMLVSRNQEMAKVRGRRARMFAKEDDEEMKAASEPKTPVPITMSLPLKKPAPSSALIGLSLLGNLDATYQHAAFPALELHTLTTGSRQRQGGMLLFGYSFAGKMWISLGWDVNAFQQGVVQDFWTRVLAGVEEFLES